MGAKGERCRRFPILAVLTSAALLLIAAAVWLGLKETPGDGKTPVFFTYREDQAAGQHYFVLQMEDQLYPIDQLDITVSGDAACSAWLYDGEGEKREEILLDLGQSSLSLSPDVAAVVICAGDSDCVSISGNLSEDGRREKQRVCRDSVFHGKNISVLGDSISAFEGYIPEGYFTFYPAGDVDGVSDMWWFQVARRMGMGICRINASAGSGVTGLAVGNREEAEDRGRQLHQPGCLPDIIFMWIGGNDAQSGIDMDTLGREYRIMLEDILAQYPKAKVFLCTYVPLSQELSMLNEEIREISSEYPVEVMDVANCGITAENYQTYLLDGSHPSRDGLLLIAAWMEQELLKMQ